MGEREQRRHGDRAQIGYSVSWPNGCESPNLIGFRTANAAQ
jgi:hypothetical protein